MNGKPKAIDAGTTWLHQGLLGSSVCFEFARLANDKDSNATIVVCSDEDVAGRMYRDTRIFFLAQGLHSHRISHFPSRKCDLNPSVIDDPQSGWKRISTLFHLLEDRKGLWVFTSLEALAQRAIPRKTLEERCGILSVGDQIDMNDLVRELVLCGYERENMVDEPGTMAQRGGILDFFPTHERNPIRIEFFGDEIESIRAFDPSTQRKTEEFQECRFCPAREILFDEESRLLARARIKRHADALNLPPASRKEFEDLIERSEYSNAFDSFLSFFYDKVENLSSYCHEDTRWILYDPFSIEQGVKELQKRIEEESEKFVREKVLMPTPRENFLSPLDVFDNLNKRAEFIFSDIILEDRSSSSVVIHQTNLHDELRQNLTIARKTDAPLRPLRDALRSWLELGYKIVFALSSHAVLIRFKKLFEKEFTFIEQSKGTSHTSIPDYRTIEVIYGHIESGGFESKTNKIVFITEEEVFGYRKHSAKPAIQKEDFFSSIRELSPGDYVVHIDHGVGRYIGLERMTAGSVEGDFIHLEYAAGDKLYLPVHRLNRVQRYIGGDGKKPQLDRLGGKSTWDKTKQKAKKAIEEMAQELVELYAARKVARGYSFGKPDTGYIRFESEFPYDETRDQMKTIDEVSVDLESERPMDRLVCGDVGFGKTEIALRAAFRSAMEGKQVAVLVPTTVLAQQHFETFKKRFANYPVRVDFLSRFKTTQDQKKVLQHLKEGTLDIVIGTHRLLSKDVHFHDLGLLVIDEEHRFGVRHKEIIKQYRNKVHVLTLTATPIPRTLQMSLTGIRDLSVINTPPLDRRSIETYLCKFEDPLIQGAIRRELSRGGQVFFLHNRVETIYGMFDFLKRLVPEARISVGHAQMSEKELEKTMLAFAAHEVDVLLCTTIIESGLDVPNANTIIMNRADKLGLAQLYQLRGRVGRSSRSSYAYLLIPGEDLISKKALKRLKVLKRFTELGSGLKIALQDLEIRGAGNLLGPQQSGQIHAIGFELYSNLLDREVRKRKGEKVEEEFDPEIQVTFPAFLPSEYVGDTGDKLLIYKRISSIKTLDELDLLRRELEDRFGRLPPPAENLFRIVDLKILSREMGILSIRFSDATSTVEISDKAPINVDKLMKMMKKDKRLTFRTGSKLSLNLTGRDYDPVEELKAFLLEIKA